MSGLRSRVDGLEKKDGGPELARLVLREIGGGRYSHRGTGKTYTQAEVDRMGDLVTIIRIGVVRKAAENGTAVD